LPKRSRGRTPEAGPKKTLIKTILLGNDFNLRRERKKKRRERETSITPLKRMENTHQAVGNHASRINSAANRSGETNFRKGKKKKQRIKKKKT